MNIMDKKDKIISWLQEYKEKSKIKGFVVGVSGGIDSSVVSTLCAMSGIDTILVEMPIGNQSIDLSTKHIEYLKSRYHNVSSRLLDLTNIYHSSKITLELTEDYITKDDYKKNLALANLQSRLRMTQLYFIAGLNEYVVVGTGNKVEDFGIYFYTKYGDGGVDISPIADLMKSEVYTMAKEMNLLEEIVNVIPSDGLWEGSITDEEQIGASYDELEWAMEISNSIDIDNNDEVLSLKSSLSDRECIVLDIYVSRNKAGRHKSEPIPICKFE